MSDASANNKYKSLAKAALSNNPPDGCIDASSLKKSVKLDISVISRAYKASKITEKQGKTLPSHLEWIADNYYIFEEKANEVLHSLKNHCRLQASVHLSGTKTPRFYNAFKEYFSMIDTALDNSCVKAFISASDERTAASRPEFADYYSMQLLFTAAVLSKVAETCSEILSNPFSSSQGEYAHELARCVVSLKYLAVHQFDKSFENCLTEEYLRQDPAGFYQDMTKETKDFYRSRIAFLSKKSGIKESDYAKTLLDKARSAAEGSRFRHIGAYLYPAPGKAVKAAYFVLLYSLITAVCLPLCLYSPIFTLIIFPVWEAAKQLCDRLFSAFIKTPALPRLDLDRLPDTDGVLVTITTLLFGEKADREIFSRLEKLYLSNGMDNVYFSVLGDYSDSPHADNPSDREILENASLRINALNQKYGNHFFLFIRPRKYSKTQNAFMGYERKRGAVTQLVRFLCGKEDLFIQNESSMPRSLCNRIRYVITLDADTNLSSDSVKEMACTMLHPLNRPVIDEKRHIVISGYGIMQPRVAPELSAAAKTPFSRILCGCGGMETYSFARFDLYQSVFSEAIFCGKGIFDKYAFENVINCKDTEFPNDSVLSHDILEGSRLRAALISDLEVTDGFPKNALSYFKRHHRWVRGDIQNLAFILRNFTNASGKKVKNNISPLSKYKLFDNVRREITPIFSFACLLAASFTPKVLGSVLIFFSLIPYVLPLIFDTWELVRTLGFQCAARRFFSKGVTGGIWQSLSRAFISVATLPKNAFVTLDAILRSLWRMLVSKKRLLEWVTAAQSDAASDAGLLYYVQKNLITAALGVCIFIFSPDGFLKLIGLTWFFTPAILYFLSGENTAKDNVSAKDRTAVSKLKKYAGDMWRYFENTVGPDDSFLPIDNLQLFPCDIYAHRTSPTNIGLYLVCALCARDFGFIDSENLYARLDNTLTSIEKMKKWKGHLYNWYDTRSLSLLEPKYISSVDSGNFLACLIVLKEGVKQYIHEKTEFISVCRRIENLFEETDLSAIYNKNTDRFLIGVPVDENGNAIVSGGNDYDMLMSEARTLSYIALAKREVPKKHWAKLSRPLVKKADRIGVASWTGTAFEYFMPALFLPTVKGSLMYEALRFAFYCQRQRYALTDKGYKVWGISESGYFAFDSDMNYRYRAFGIPELGLKRGLENDLVISPYSSFLALCLNHTLPLANLKKLSMSGLYGKYGFYEACDFTPGRSAGAGAPVKSYMSHHVGMSFIACANACFDNITVKRFMNDARMRSAHEFLEEKIPVDAVVRKIRKTGEQHRKPCRFPEKKYISMGAQKGEDPFCRVISDGFTGIMGSSLGSVKMFFGNKIINACDKKYENVKKGFFTFFKYDNLIYSPSVLPFESNAGKYSFEYSGGAFSHVFENDSIKAKTSYSIMADNSSVSVNFTARRKNNPGIRNSTLKTAFCFEPVMMNETAFASHPAFNSLFIVSRYDKSANAIIFEKRVRDEDTEKPVFLAVGFENKNAVMEFCTKKQDLFSTPFSVSDYNTVFESELDNKTGACVSPFCLIRTELAFSREMRCSCRLLLCISQSEKEATEKLENARAANKSENIEKAENLETLLLMGSGLFTERNAAAIVSEICSKIMFPEKYLPESESQTSNAERSSKGCLWESGISGDLPLITVEIPSAKAAKRAEIFIKAFVLLKKKKISFDMALLYKDSEKYRRPCENAVLSILEKCGASEYLKKHGGGIFVVDRNNLSDNAKALLAYSYGIFDAADTTRNVYNNQFIQNNNQKNNVNADIIVKPNISETTNASESHKDLDLYSGNGYFEPNSSYVVLKDKPFAVVQSMVLSGRMLSTVITHNSFGYTFGTNSVLKRISPFENDPTDDMSGERIFLVSGEKMFDLAAVSEKVIYGRGFAEYHGICDGIKYSVRVYIPEKLPVKIFDIDTGGKEASFTFALKPVMGEKNEENRLCKLYEREERAEFINEYSEYFSNYTGFLKGIGKDVSYEFPESGLFAGHVLCKMNSGRQKYSRFILGCYKNGTSDLNYIFDHISKNISADSSNLQTSAENFAGHVIPKISVKSDASSDVGKSLCHLFNFWLPYQNGICRMRARSGFYQSGGAYGFRDQLQDALTLMYADAAEAKSHIIRSAAHQFEDGSALHWWHQCVPCGNAESTTNTKGFLRGIRSECSDDYLFLVYAVCEYIKFTGDNGLADIMVKYVTSEPLENGESEKYVSAYKTDFSESIFMHCVRALERAYLRIGAKGLALLGSGDWCDGLNKAGSGMRGESVWLSMFLKFVTDMFCDVFSGDEKKSEYCDKFSQKSAKLAENIKKHAYDQSAGYFLRAWYDDGTPIGSQVSDECNIELISQAFSVFAGLPPAMSFSAIRNAYEKLYDSDAKIFKLLSPPFSACAKNPGYIKGYAPGIRENGGQYTHGAAWGCMAMIISSCNVLKASPNDSNARKMLSDGVHALINLLPVYRCTDKQAFEIYKCEPYVLCGDIYAGDNPGRGGWSWYTGSASWLWRAVLNCLFGITLTGTLGKVGTTMDITFMPSAFRAPFIIGSHFEISLEFPERNLHLTVNYNKTGTEGLLLDGTEQASHRIELSSGKHVVDVEGI